MIITSTNDVKGYEVTYYLGLINANIVIGVNMFYDWFASWWTDQVGGYSTTYQRELDKIYEKALAELESKAYNKGADAILGVHFDFDEISAKGKSMFMVTAFGTAVKMAPKREELVKEDRYEIYQKLYKLSQFKEAGIITAEQYEAEKANLLFSHEEEIEKELQNIKTENNQKEAIKQAQILSKQLEEERKKEEEAKKTEKEKQIAIRKEKEVVIKNAIEIFKSNASTIFVKLGDILDLNIKSPKFILDNLSYKEIVNANYDDMNINPTDKMAYTIGRFIKEEKIAAACKYYIDIVNDDDIEYAKSYVYSIYEIITFKKQSAFESMALNLVELKYLGKEEEAIYEFMKYSICSRDIAKQVIDML